METIKLSIQINVPKEKVWEVLWNDDSYKQWTAVFCEGSCAVSDWNEGSKIRFLDANGNGMFSVIEKKIPNQQMSFKHLGEIKDGVEISTEWAGATENYFLAENENGTELTTVMDSNEEFKEYFETTFPKALQIVKQLSEKWPA
ncbi:MAG: SRPBCC domain-containing protein [Prolixibacteraceae bacterium]|nr:SRPBCC domain-containing protein [Prolixibacteraceae bacterium]